MLVSPLNSSVSCCEGWTPNTTLQVTLPAIVLLGANVVTELFRPAKERRRAEDICARLAFAAGRERRLAGSSAV